MHSIQRHTEISDGKIKATSCCLVLWEYSDPIYRKSFLSHFSARQISDAFYSQPRFRLTILWLMVHTLHVTPGTINIALTRFDLLNQSRLRRCRLSLSFLLIMG